MKILQAHNFYQIGGGEDTVVNAERAELEKAGHTVIPFYKSNSEIEAFGLLDKVRLLKTTTYSKTTYQEAVALIKKEKPDICHVHNFLPLISPAIFQACADQNIPVVQTLHNYRLICSNGLLMRKGKVCELCLGKSAYQAVAKKCYRDSAIQTYAVARMIEKNKQKGTWQNSVAAYICLTDFAKSKFIAHGIPEEKLMVKANFVAQSMLSTAPETEPYLVFAGRVTASKGIDLLKKIAHALPIPLKVIGEGDSLESLKGVNNIHCLGKLSREETLHQIKNAKALILPSLWYEGMPMTILEAFSLKTPVIASQIGAMESLIQHKKNGLLFEVNSEVDLLVQINFLLAKNKLINEIIEKAFNDYEQLYNPNENVKALIEIYKMVTAEKE